MQIFERSSRFVMVAPTAEYLSIGRLALRRTILYRTKRFSENSTVSGRTAAEKRPNIEWPFSATAERLLHLHLPLNERVFVYRPTTTFGGGPSRNTQLPKKIRVFSSVPGNPRWGTCSQLSRLPSKERLPISAMTQVCHHNDVLFSLSLPGRNPGEILRQMKRCGT